MKVWRLALRRHSLPDGVGAQLFGGRWNRRGTPAVYTSSSLSLALLEYLVHLDSDLLPDGLVSIQATIPADLRVESVEPPPLPKAWRRGAGDEALQERGTAWLQGKSAAVLRVPSAIVPIESNYVLNPLHADFSRIVWEKPMRFVLDPRLLVE